MKPAENGKPNLPPRWPDRLLTWLVAPHLREEVLGDLRERYHRRSQRRGVVYARRHYWREVVSYLRSAVLRRKPSDSTNPFSPTMLRNYFTTTWRALIGNKSYGAINVTGLTLSLACCLLLCVVVTHELSYDAYHRRADRIYRVETRKIQPEGTDTYPGAPLGVASALRTDFPEIEKVTTINFHDSRLISVRRANGSEVKFKESLVFVDEDLFSVFDYQWIAGNPRTALAEPNAVVVTQRYAERYFGTTSAALGQTIALDNRLDLKITGVLQNPPTNTNFPFNLLVSSATQKSLDEQFNPNQWGGWSVNAQTYVLLTENADPQTVESRFPKMWDKYHGGGISKTRGSSLLALKELHFSGNYSGRSVEWKTIYIMAIIGVFLILTACINFVNLATAQSIKRSKEVGIRKVLGSRRGQLIGQFLGETGLLTLVATLLAVGLAFLLLPSVSSLLAIPVTGQSLLNPTVLLFLAVAWVTVSLLSGLYPALVLSSFQPVQAIKNKITSRRAGGTSLAKTMVVLQFAISQVLLIGTVIVARQMDLFREADLGFDQESIVTVPIPTQDEGKLNYLRTQLTRLPEIQHVSFSFNSASAESNFMGELAYQTSHGEVTIRTQFKLADAHFIPTYGIQLLAGKGLPDVDSSSQIVVNEVFLQRMGIQSPQAALGEIIRNGEQALQIVGVARNFHVNSLHQPIDPAIIGINSKFFFQAGIKIASSGAGRQKAVAHIERVWTRTFPDQIFSYAFLDETLNQAYQREDRTFYLVNLFSGIAIFISCLGLYGLVSFLAVQRTKEIGIRKVMGASVTSLVALLLRDFIKLVLVAFLIASPVAWWTMQRWLQGFAYRVSISWWIFALVGGLAVIITLLTVGLQAIKAAVANPVKSLRIE